MATAAPLHPTPAHNLSASFSTTSPPSTQTSRTSPEPTIPRGSVTSSLHFYAPPLDNYPPFNYVEQPPAGHPQRNFTDDPHDISINDLRGHEHAFTLDANAFQALTNVPPSAERDFTSDASIKSTYYPEVERLLLDNVPGAHRILLFDHTIRRANPDAARAPVTRVHIDQTPASAAVRVRHHLPDKEADELLRGRYRIINVWRPLNGPVVSFPLGFADSSTVADEDLVGIEHRYPDRTGETAGVKFSEKQRWYYWSGMGNDERLLLKCSDSDEGVGAWGRVPHTAFVDPRTPEGAPGRESIEVRALVFG